jgi:outer membrane protein OmpA-like peptidoglycan-associated protein
MKRLYFILGALALMTVALTAAPSAFAQENGNRDENGKVVRGPYQTNSFGDNWFIGAGGGVNILWKEGYDIAVSPSVDANVGKWFTPSVGMRAGYQGFQSRIWSEAPSILGEALDSDKGMYEQKFGYMYFHGDFLWNMSNALGGYKETRFWNLVPYLHAGFYRAYGLDGVDYGNNEIAAGAGLIHNLRLTDRLDIVIDMRATVVNGRIIESVDPVILPSVTAGLAVDLGWPNFVRTSSVIGALELANAEQIITLETAALALEVANAALAAENQQLAAENENLANDINRLKNTPVETDDADFFEGMVPAVYFEIGKTVLSHLEMKHLEFIAESIIAKADDADITITVMGSADSNTGTTKRNIHLSEARGKYISDILTGKYGISPDRLVLKSEVVKAVKNPEFARAVVFTF